MKNNEITPLNFGKKRELTKEEIINYYRVLILFDRYDDFEVPVWLLKQILKVVIESNEK